MHRGEGGQGAGILDAAGRLAVNSNLRLLRTTFIFSIPLGGTTSTQVVDPLVVFANGAGNLVAFDDKTRLAAEVITLQGTWDPLGGAGNWFGVSSLFGSTVGVEVGVGGNIFAQYLIRLSSAQAVAAARTFTFVLST